MIAQTGNNPNIPSIGEHINCSPSIPWNTTEQKKGMKIYYNMTFIITWVDLKIMMPNGKKPDKKRVNTELLHLCKI